MGRGIVSAYATSYTTGRIANGEYEVVSVPRLTPSTPQRPIIFTHGYTPSGSAAGAAASSAVTQGHYGAIFLALCTLGSVVISADFGGNSWGNSTASSRVESARTLAVSLGAKNDKAIVVGCSMGFLTGFGYARDYTGKLAGLFGICPAADLNDIRTNNRADTASINTALGLSSGATLPAQYDPTQSATTLSGITGRLFYGTADSVILPNTVTNLANVTSWTATVFDTTNQHLSDAQLANFPVATLLGLVQPLL